MELYDWQQEYLKDMPPRYIMAASTGVGKTVMSLAKYHEFYPKSDMPLLIIAPASKVRTGEWEIEIQAYFADKVLPEYNIYSYEGISRDKKRSKKLDNGAWRTWIEPAPFKEILNTKYALIADECHKIANPQSIMGNAVYQLAINNPFFIGLSATPLPNSWMSVANYFKIWGFSKNITEFKRRYVNEDRSRNYPVIVGYFYEDELKARWNSISKQLKKEDVLKPNEILELRAPLPNTDEYHKVEATRLLDGTVLDNPALYAHGLRQVTHKGKLDWLESVLDSTDENVLIFYNYIKEREAMLKLLKKLKTKTVFRIDGELQDQPPKNRWSKLTNTVTLAQYRSGSTGIELTYNSMIIFFGPTYSYAEYMQAIGRVDRIGQTKPITIYKPYLRGSIEGKIWQAIARKEDFQELVWYNQHESE